MLKTYGLDVNGHFWDDDLKKMGWLGPRDELINEQTAMWLILTTEETLSSPSYRYGLSVLTMSVQAVRDHGFPIILLHEGEIKSLENLPTPLQGAEVLQADNPSVGAKIVAAASMPRKKTEAEYRLDIHAMPQMGLWFEAGSAGAGWKGAMFGVCGGEIDAHGVGPAGKLPQKAVLEYPMKGLKLNFGEKEYTAWAVKNELGEGLSYYARVQGEPESILLGPFSEGEEADVYVLRIK